MAEKVEVLDLGFVNAYLVKAKEGFVLVDTGLAGTWHALEKRLRSAGCAPGLLKLVLLTHADRDHSGNCVRLKSEYKVPVAVHQLDSPALETGVSPRRTIRTLSGRILFGFIGLLGRMRSKVGAFQTFTPDMLLADGQSLEAFGLAAKVIHLPGHTKGSIAVLTETGELFAGDLFTNRRKPDLSPYVENFDEYRASLEKAKLLAPSIKTVYPGHGTPFPAERLGTLSL